jgi:hypothetical protein
MIRLRPDIRFLPLNLRARPARPETEDGRMETGLAELADRTIDGLFPNA